MCLTGESIGDLVISIQVLLEGAQYSIPSVRILMRFSLKIMLTSRVLLPYVT